MTTWENKRLGKKVGCQEAETEMQFSGEGRGKIGVGT